MKELPKVYEPGTVETRWYKEWESKKLFAPNKSAKANKSFVILMPPPNVTGKLHMGHALDHTCQDILIRFKRMKGFETLWIPGYDHAGISTQAVVEKKVFETEGKTKGDLGRDAFVRKIWEWKEEYGGHIVEQLKRIGDSCDWDYFTFTMDDIPNKAVKKVFVDWYNRGLIYQSDYIVHWDPILQSAISDAEVEYEDVDGAYFTINYQVKGSSEVIPIATTRPETLLGDTGVAVHPDDERYRHLIGKTAIVPIVSREVPIVGDAYVDREKGTGCLKVTPGHDFNDFDIGKRHQLDIIVVMNPDGTIKSEYAEYAGLAMLQARKKIVAELEKSGILIGIENVVHPVGHGQRSGEIVEPLVSKQWFVSIKDLAQKAKSAVEEGDMQFLPKSWENTYFSWLNAPRDWCISRQLWWGHQIPVFTCKDCGHQWASEENSKNCPQCQSKQVLQDQDVLDTWFSSGLFPLATLGWPNEDAMKKRGFDRYYPSDVLVTSFDIIFFWVARMMMMGLDKTEKTPFKTTYIHAMVRDKNGKKMSKSAGNGVDPIELIDRYGADTMRLTLAADAGHNRHLNLDPKKMEGYRNYVNKLWNVFRFLSPFIREAKSGWPPLSDLDTHDKWLLHELNEVTKAMNRELEQCRFDDAVEAIYQFTYNIYCSWYLELSKEILYDKGEQTVGKRERKLQVLKSTFECMLELLHPIIPFFTEELWSHLGKGQGDYIIVADYPEFNEQWSFEREKETMNKITELVTGVRSIRSEFQLSPKKELEALVFVADSDLAKGLYQSREDLRILANVTKGKILPKENEKPSKAAMVAFEFGEVYVPLEGLVDFDMQRKKISRELEKAEKEFDKLSKKLSSAQFVDKAPEQVVREVKMKHSGFNAKIESLREKLSYL